MSLLQRGLLVVGLSAGSLAAAFAQSAVPASSQPAPGPSVQPSAPSADVERLRRDLDQILRGGGGRDARHSVLVVSLQRGDTLYSLQPDLAVAPASNMKLYSTAAALYYLGPDFRYSTYVLGAGEVRDSVLSGDLILYGTGDPAISGRMLPSAQAALQALADSVAAQGIREIRGDVVGDGSYFDDAWVGEGWEDDDRMAWYGAPVGALSFAENLVRVRITPGGSAGATARIQTVPETRGLAIENRVRTVASGASRVRFTHGPQRLIVEGQIRRGAGGITRSLPIVDPSNYTAAAFRAALEARGIRVSGDVRTVSRADSSAVSLAGGASRGGGAPPRVLAVHLSPPLSELVNLTNQISHNLYADALLKTVGRVALGEGSFRSGARAVRYFLESEAWLDSAALQIVDGSGLSGLNRVTARNTIHLLDFMRRSEAWESFFASLPEAAAPNRLPHSLRNRMGGTAAARNLRAKTGTIRNVSSLSGYVRAANGELLAFSIFANGVPSPAQAKGIEDRIGARLAGFTRPAAEGGTVQPEPAVPAPIGAAPPARPAEAPGRAEAPADRSPTGTQRGSAPDADVQDRPGSVPGPISPATSRMRGSRHTAATYRIPCDPPAANP